MDPRDSLIAIYFLAAIFGVACCWLWFRSPKGKPMHEAGTAGALAIGLTSVGFLLSQFM